MTNRRPRGTGRLYQEFGSWYGMWRVNGQRVNRVLGPVRKPRTNEGLTQSMAEARLRALIAEVTQAEPVRERYTIEDIGRKHIANLRRLGRRENTLESYESYLTIHLSPYFESRPISQIDVEEIEGLIDHLLASGQSPKSVRNYLGLLHGIFDFALKKRYLPSTRGNPCKLAEKPRDPDRSDEIHFLDETEVDALVRAVPHDDLGRVEAVLYRTAAWTGLRQGELLALRWRDIDWANGWVRVHRSLSRGKIGPTKSYRSRAVPLVDELGGDLDRHSKVTAWRGDDDLVFAHPHTGKALDRSRLLKRYKAALRRAKVREVSFHDLRHTFGTQMAAAGVPLVKLQEWLGHRDAQTTERYRHFAPAGNERALANEAYARAKLRAKLRTTQQHETTENPVNPGVED